MIEAAPAPTGIGPVLADQTINVESSPMPPAGAFMRWTDRDVQVGARADQQSFRSLDDAISAAREMSAGRRPGVAVLPENGGTFGLHQLRTYSRSYQAVSSHAGQMPYTRLTAQSNVPFAIGNFRFDDSTALPRVENGPVAAVIDGARSLVPSQRGDGWVLQPARPASS